MKLQLGSILLEISQSSPEQIDIKLTTPGKVVRTQPPAGAAAVREAPPQREIESTSDPNKDVKTLISAGFTKKTLAMIVNKVLEIPVTGSSLVSKFRLAVPAAERFLQRPITDDVWAMFVAPVDVYEEGQMLAAIGLTGRNQLVVMALDPVGKPREFFNKLIARGLSPDQLKLGILSFHADAINEFRQAFPNTQLGLDWQEFIETQDDAEAAHLQSVMSSEDRITIQKALNRTKAPKELATFMDFDRNLWRALRTTTPIQRLSRDLKSKMRSRMIHTKHERELVKNFSLVRLQYHWFKIPVDAPQLKNLKYIQDAQLSIDSPQVEIDEEQY